MTEDEKKLVMWYVVGSRSVHKELDIRDEMMIHGIECYVPLELKERRMGGRKVSSLVPAITGLIFARTSYNTFRSYQLTTGNSVYLRKAVLNHAEGLSEYMTVDDSRMEAFIQFTTTFQNDVHYRKPEELALREGETVMVAINGKEYEAEIMRVAGKRNRQLVVQIPQLAAATFSITPEVVKRISGFSDKTDEKSRLLRAKRKEKDLTSLAKRRIQEKGNFKEDLRKLLDMAKRRPMDADMKALLKEYADRISRLQKEKEEKLRQRKTAQLKRDINMLDKDIRQIDTDIKKAKDERTDALHKSQEKAMAEMPDMERLMGQLAACRPANVSEEGELALALYLACVKLGKDTSQPRNRLNKAIQRLPKGNTLRLEMEKYAALADEYLLRKRAMKEEKAHDERKRKEAEKARKALPKSKQLDEDRKELTDEARWLLFTAKERQKKEKADHAQTGGLPTLQLKQEEALRMEKMVRLRERIAPYRGMTAEAEGLIALAMYLSSVAIYESLADGTDASGAAEKAEMEKSEERLKTAIGKLKDTSILRMRMEGYLARLTDDQEKMAAIVKQVSAWNRLRLSPKKEEFLKEMKTVISPR